MGESLTGEGGSASSVRYRFAADLRHRRLAWLGIAVIIGLSAGVVIALVAGARRSDTAVDRFIEYADPQEHLVISGIPTVFDFAEVDVDEVAELPGVADSQRIGVLSGAGRTDGGLLVDSGNVNFLADAGGRVGTTFSRFKFLDGRPADPADPREIVAVFRTAEAFDLEVGSTIDMNFFDQDELRQVFTPLEEGGSTFAALSTEEPLERLEVVGIVVSAGEMAPPEGDATTSIWMTPAAAEEFGDSELVQTVLVDLEDGAAGSRAFLERVESLGGGRPVYSTSTAEDAAVADEGVTPVVRALFLAAALLGVVTVLVAGQVLARQAATESGDDRTLRALGWTRGDLLRLRVAKASMIAAVAALTASVVAVALSPVFPLGLADLVDPDRGVRVDGVVTMVGFVAVVVAVALLSAVTGWWQLRRSVEGAVSRPSRIVGAVTTAGAPTPLVAGTAMAFQSPARGTPAPVWAAAGTMVLGVSTVIGVLCFMASLGRLTETPRLYGWTWDVAIGQEFSPELSFADLRWLREAPEVDALAIGTKARFETDRGPVEVYAVGGELGGLEPSLIDGRAARGLGEAVVTPELGDIGDRLTARFAGVQTDLVIVGHTAIPAADAVVTFETLRELAPESARQIALVDLRPGADADAFVDRLVGPPLALAEQDIQLPALPEDLINFGRVDTAPAAVAGAMGLVAIATLVHALVSTVRRRRHDLAVLRVLGFTGRQVLTAVSWQATALVVAAAVPALMVGIAIGRFAWLRFADELRVVAEPVVPVALLLAAILGSLVLANLVALSAGRWASRRSAAVVLRTE